jgi:hypothetical protein
MSGFCACDKPVGSVAWPLRGAQIGFGLNAPLAEDLGHSYPFHAPASRSAAKAPLDCGVISVAAMFASCILASAILHCMGAYPHAANIEAPTLAFLSGSFIVVPSALRWHDEAERNP